MALTATFFHALTHPYRYRNTNTKIYVFKLHIPLLDTFDVVRHPWFRFPESWDTQVHGKTPERLALWSIGPDEIESVYQFDFPQVSPPSSPTDEAMTVDERIQVLLQKLLGRDDWTKTCEWLVNELWRKSEVPYIIPQPRIEFVRHLFDSAPGEEECALLDEEYLEPAAQQE
jgi:hypothetical protein